MPADFNDPRWGGYVPWFLRHSDFAARGDSIFAEAFKTLEPLARDITLDSGFVFDKSHLEKHFPLLHSTIHQTLIRLGGHRGDKAGHGKDAPPLHENRYLLIAVCNSALLLLDYPGNSTKG